MVVLFDVNSDAVLVRHRVRGGYQNRWLVREEVRVPGLMYRLRGLAWIVVPRPLNTLARM